MWDFSQEADKHGSQNGAYSMKMMSKNTVVAEAQRIPLNHWLTIHSLSTTLAGSSHKSVNINHDKQHGHTLEPGQWELTAFLEDADSYYSRENYSNKRIMISTIFLRFRTQWSRYCMYSSRAVLPNLRAVAHNCATAAVEMCHCKLLENSKIITVLY